MSFERTKEEEGMISNFEGRMNRVRRFFQLHSEEIYLYVKYFLQIYIKLTNIPTDN